MILHIIGLILKIIGILLLVILGILLLVIGVLLFVPLRYELRAEFPGKLEDAEGNPLEEPRTPQMEFRMKLPRQVPAYSILRHAVQLST